MPENPRISTEKILIFTFLILFLSFSIIWPGMKFWNLQKDLTSHPGLFDLIPSSLSLKAVDLPMPVGLRLPPDAELAGDDFHHQLEINKGKITPASRTEFLARVPDYAIWLKKTGPAIDAEMAKLTTPVDFSRIKFTTATTEIDVIDLTTIVRSWNSLALCLADHVSPAETCRLLLGLSLQHAMAESRLL